MSKEKQIEEMARHCHFCEKGKCLLLDDETVKCDMNCDMYDFVEHLYNAGYRKQSEGEWIWINQAKGYLEPPYGDTCKCSLCEFVIDVSESNYKFCPNCGAKMKGGE